MSIFSDTYEDDFLAEQFFLKHDPDNPANNAYIGIGPYVNKFRDRSHIKLVRDCFEIKDGVLYCKYQRSNNGILWVVNEINWEGYGIEEINTERGVNIQFKRATVIPKRIVMYRQNVPRLGSSVQLDCRYLTGKYISADKIYFVSPGMNGEIVSNCELYADLFSNSCEFTKFINTKGQLDVVSLHGTDLYDMDEVYGNFIRPQVIEGIKIKDTKKIRAMYNNQKKYYSVLVKLQETDFLDVPGLVKAMGLDKVEVKEIRLMDRLVKLTIRKTDKGWTYKYDLR